MIGSVLLAVGPSNVNFVFAIRWPWRKTASLTVFSGALGKPVYVYVTPVQLKTTLTLGSSASRSGGTSSPWPALGPSVSTSAHRSSSANRWRLRLCHARSDRSPSRAASRRRMRLLPDSLLINFPAFRRIALLAKLHIGY